MWLVRTVHIALLTLSFLVGWSVACSPDRIATSTFSVFV